jgi:hypothetical protein
MMERVRKREKSCRSPSPVDDVLAHNPDACNPELPQILYNLKHMEARLRAMDKSLFPESADQPSPTDQREYQRNLERIQNELSTSGFPAHRETL